MAEINVVGESGDIEVWLDTEIEECDGVCIGHAITRIQALDDARTELQARLADVEQMMRDADTDARLGGDGA
jgi:hypothetical protein